MKCYSSKQFSLHCLWKLKLVVVRLSRSAQTAHVKQSIQISPSGSFTMAHGDADEASLVHSPLCFSSISHDHFSGSCTSSQLLDVLGFFPSPRKSPFSSAFLRQHSMIQTFPSQPCPKKHLAPMFLPLRLCSVFSI